MELLEDALDSIIRQLRQETNNGEYKTPQSLELEAIKIQLQLYLKKYSK